MLSLKADSREEVIEVARAYLKILVEAGMEREVCNTLKKLPEVKSADLTTGDQDIIAVIEAPSYETLLKTIVEEMRQIKGISSTSTSLVLD
ncbi:MAG: Lrp/AsnC ligand binding domain-containing protein [Candidatus Hydrogenedentota bacterium]|nr:MAG: Lrp/AsnC ligand binding domain-containing protein [Candidatus Hydrogenedentota bacterium]